MASGSSTFSFSLYQDLDDVPPNLTCSLPCINFILHFDHVLRSPDPPHHVDEILHTYSDSVAFPLEELVAYSAFPYYIFPDTWSADEEVVNAVLRLLTFAQELVNDPSNMDRRVISIVVHFEVTVMPDNGLQPAAASKGDNRKLENFEVKGLKFAEHECVICLEKLSDGDDKTAATAAMLPCGHVYDNDCILKWLNTRNTCPICRYEVSEI